MKYIVIACIISASCLAMQQQPPLTGPQLWQRVYNVAKQAAQVAPSARKEPQKLGKN